MTKFDWKSQADKNRDSFKAILNYKRSEIGKSFLRKWSGLVLNDNHAQTINKPLKLTTDGKAILVYIESQMSEN